MAHSEYDLIKKNNGEHFARAIRDANLLELPNIVERVKYAGRTPEPELIRYLLAQKAEHDLIDTYTTTTDPFELLHRAGYSFVEYADTLKKQNAIKKYFAKDEELCTFKDDTRYQEYYIINAVHRDADKIKRSPKPERQDAYGTSVISIQIAKQGGFISIKNRYNHSVAHPDNTFYSNPDNIIPGLSAALTSYFKVKFNASEVPLPDGITLIDDRIIKYNYEIDNVYIGDFFWESHGKIHEIDRSTQIMMDYFYFDIKQNKVVPIVPDYDDCFADVLNAEIDGRRVTIRGKFPNQSLWLGDTCLVEMDGPAVKSLNLAKTTEIRLAFLCYNKKLTSFRAPNLSKVGYAFFSNATHIKELDVPNLRNVGDNFLAYNDELIDAQFPKLETAGNNFLATAYNLRTLYAPQLNEVGHNFLESNSAMKSLSLPNLRYAGDYFMSHSTLESLDLPMLKQADSFFLYYNDSLTSLNAPMLTSVMNNFLCVNTTLKELYLLSLSQIGAGFLCHNKLNTFVAPNLNQIDLFFMGTNSDASSFLQHLVLGPYFSVKFRWMPRRIYQLLIPQRYTTGINRFFKLPSDKNTQMVMPLTPQKPHTR